MSRTFNVSKNTVVGLIETKPEVAQPEVIQPILLTEILGDTDSTIRSTLLDSFISSVNMSLIAQCRSEVMFGSHHVSDDPTWAEFDKLRAQEETNAIDTEFAAVSGGKVRVPAGEIAKQLGRIRAYALKMAFEANTARAPRSLWESVAWMVDQMPTEALPTDPAVKVIALMTNKPVEVVCAMRNNMFATDRQKLVKAAPKIIGLAEQFSEDVVDAEMAEQAFDALPGIVQINVMTSACNALVSVHTRGFKQVLRGRASAATDMALAEAIYARARVHRERLLVAHASDVADLEDSGGQLKELKRI